MSISRNESNSVTPGSTLTAPKSSSSGTTLGSVDVKKDEATTRRPSAEPKGTSSIPQKRAAEGVDLTFDQPVKRNRVSTEDRQGEASSAKQPSVTGLTISEYEYMAAGAKRLAAEANTKWKNLPKRGDPDHVEEAERCVDKVKEVYRDLRTVAKYFDQKKDILDNFDPELHGKLNDCLDLLGNRLFRRDEGSRDPYRLQMLEKKVQEGRDAIRKARDDKIAQAKAVYNGHKANQKKWQDELKKAKEAAATSATSPKPKEPTW